MTSRQWMQIAAVASAIGLAGGACANEVNHATQAPDTPATVQSDPSGSNPAADLGTNADVNGGAGLDNPDNRGNANRTNRSATPSTDQSGTSSSTDQAGTSSSTDRSMLNDNKDDTARSGATSNSAGAANGESSSDATGQIEPGATQGSTMTSPKPNSAVDADAPGGGPQSSATQSGEHNRFADSNSNNFNNWMSDYASQHNGRISRDEFMAQMQRRWDERDTQHSGLTPYEVEEIFVFTPADNGTASEGSSDLQSSTSGQSGGVQ